MKRKYYLGLFVLVIVAGIGFAGCSDSGTDASDPEGEGEILGSWQLSSLVLTTNGTDTEFTEWDPCLLETVLTFEADGVFHSLTSTSEGDGCSTIDETGTWEHQGGNTYRFEADGLPIGQGTQELSFFNNGNSFSFSEEVQFEGFGGLGTVTFDRQ